MLKLFFAVLFNYGPKQSHLGSMQDDARLRVRRSMERLHCALDQRPFLPDAVHKTAARKIDH